jgi:hypothetical protein
MTKFECPECGYTTSSENPECFCPLCGDGHQQLMHRLLNYFHRRILYQGNFFERRNFYDNTISKNKNVADGTREKTPGGQISTKRDF